MYSFLPRFIIGGLGNQVTDEHIHRLSNRVIVNYNPLHLPKWRTLKTKNPMFFPLGKAWHTWYSSQIDSEVHPLQSPRRIPVPVETPRGWNNFYREGSDLSALSYNGWVEYLESNSYFRRQVAGTCMSALLIVLLVYRLTNGTGRFLFFCFCLLGTVDCLFLRFYKNTCMRIIMATLFIYEPQVGIFSRRNHEIFSNFKNSKSTFLMKVSVKHWNFQIKLNCGVENTGPLTSRYEVYVCRPVFWVVV